MAHAKCNIGCLRLETYIEYTNMSSYNTTIYFIYLKTVYRQALTIYYFKEK